MSENGTVENCAHNQQLRVECALGMTADTMREFIFSLAWFDCSAYHHGNVHGILARTFPETDFTDALKGFLDCRDKKGKGSPRI